MKTNLIRKRAVVCVCVLESVPAREKTREEWLLSGWSKRSRRSTVL